MIIINNYDNHNISSKCMAFYQSFFIIFLLIGKVQ